MGRRTCLVHHPMPRTRLRIDRMFLHEYPLPFVASGPAHLPEHIHSEVGNEPVLARRVNRDEVVRMARLLT